MRARLHKIKKRNKDKTQKKEDSEESREGNWATVASGAVGGWGVKRVAAGGKRGVCLHGCEMLRAFCLFVFDRAQLSSLLASRPNEETAKVNAGLLRRRLLLHN